MRTQHDFVKALLSGIALLSTVGVAQAQNTVSLTATRQTALMPTAPTCRCGAGSAAPLRAAVGANLHANERRGPDRADHRHQYRLAAAC